MVRQVLEGYATRGVFRTFSQGATRGSRTEFRFTWFRDVPFRIVYDARLRTLTFVDVLPEVPARSEMDRALRAFLRERSAKSLPEHRRIDPSRATARCVNRRDRVSVVVTTRKGHVEYAARKTVNLVHEIFMDFLNDPRFVPYQIDHLRLDPELA